ncbi:hypothetical protein OUZ56_011989 [Daphnia magna]|uniref:MON2 protein n=1 Tax=Daphnia magna TaxID=35525 RepID=A0ABQ9Z1P8_9CRUS|nr:hypothetical protein OUZ56_011989 [Daphnia magna]
MVSTWYVRRGPYQKTAPFRGFSLVQWDGHVTILSSHAVVGPTAREENDGIYRFGWETCRERSPLFAVAKLLATGLVNLNRAEVLWRPVTNHLLEVIIHPLNHLREWGIDVITTLVRSAIQYEYSTPLKENQVLKFCNQIPPIDKIFEVYNPNDVPKV